MPPIDPEHVARWVTIILCVGALLASGEDMAASSVFADRGVLSWRVLELQNRYTAVGFTALIAQTLFKRGGMIALAGIRAAAAALLIWASWSSMVSAVLLGIIYLSLFALTLRSPYGLDGAHQMYRLCFGALVLFHIASPGSIAARACLYLIGGQAAFSYLVSGLNKAVSPTWRDGTALTGIFSASLYGHPQVYRLLHAAPRFALLASWGVIVFECWMPFAVFMSKPWCLTLLAVGATFHLVNAVLMGLNNFVFAFIGAYPAIYLMAHDLRG